MVFRAELHSEIEIDATPERVWEELTDLPGHAEWDPFLVEASGEVREGARLTVRMRPEGAKRTMTLRPRVLAARPGVELRWLGRLLGVPFLFDGEHRFELTEIAPGRTKLIQAERFTGVLVPPMRGWLRRSTAPAFEASNRALRGRAEAA